MKRRHFGAALMAATMALAAYGVPAKAAEPYKINVIMPLTGGGSFLGKGEQATLQALEASVNKDGGINGQPLQFVFHDDQTSPQTAVQLASGVLADKPAVVIGSSIVAMCKAMAPLMKKGPFDYCLSPGVHPAAGSFQFSSSVDTHSLIAAIVNYFRDKGLTKIAFMTSTDASGQDAERGFDAILKKPENKNVKVVVRERFNTTDVSVSAQIERIKQAHPQALIAWSTGAPIATIFKGILQAGLDVPVATTNGNQTFAQMHMYKDFLPKQLYIPTSEFLKHDGLYKLDPRVEAQQKKFYDALTQAHLGADVVASLAWDPGNMIVEALRKLGTKATAEQVRAWLASQTELPGINGLYNFKKVPQRGLTLNNAVVSRWDQAKNDFVVVSGPTGTPLKK